jgi:hypothetical protein
MRCWALLGLGRDAAGAGHWKFTHPSSPACPAPLPSAAELVARVSDVFQPRHLSVALSTDTAAPGTSCAASAWGAAFMGPLGYACHSASYQEMKCGGCVAYFVLESGDDAAVPAAAAAKPGAVAAAGAAGSDTSDTGSPRAVVKHFPSFSSGAASSLGGAGGSVLADMDLLGSDNASNDNASDNSSVSLLHWQLWWHNFQRQRQGPTVDSPGWRP